MTEGSKLYINGRFLSKSISGVSRFATEITKAMDRLLGNLELECVILAPQGTNSNLSLTNIKYKEVGPLRGHLWEQVVLPWASKDGYLVNLANSAPVLKGKRNQAVVIHDAMVFATPNNYSYQYRRFHTVLGRTLAHRSKLFTVSKFSAGELSKYLGKSRGDITVIYNGVGHLSASQQDDGVISKFGLVDTDFFVCVGSNSPNKNIKTAIQSFAAFKAKNKNKAKLVVVGDIASSIFGDTQSAPDCEDVVITGRLSDSELTALYGHACALVFPSLYEGFGIPPLEAMYYNCPVLGSNIDPVSEVCGDAYLAFDPMSETSLCDLYSKVLDDEGLRASLINKGQDQIKLYDWKASAEKLLNSILDR